MVARKRDPVLCRDNLSEKVRIKRIKAMINNQDQSPGIPSVLSSMNRLFMVGSEKFVTEA